MLLLFFFPLRTKKFRYKAKKTSTQWQDIILGGFIVHYINHLSVLSVRKPVCMKNHV